MQGWVISGCAAVLAGPGVALAQIPIEAAKPTPAALFRTQCGTCHVLKSADGERMGPPLAGVVGRKPGSAAGFKYTGNFAAADFVWDKAHLDAYLENPQAVVPGTIMVYRQARAETRAAIIGYLEEQK